jgi:transcription-repair coupling factor (superfamily II helicase)
MSNLQHLLLRYAEHPSVKQILQFLQQNTDRPRLQLSGLTGAQESFALAATAQAHQAGAGVLHLLVTNAKEEAAYRHNDLEGILSRESVYFFPDSFKRPGYFDDLNQTQILQRSETISKVSGHVPTPTIIVTYPEALFEKVVKPEILHQSRIEVKKGEKLDVDFMIQVLVEYGFERADFVYEPGQFSIRGGIIDLFSFGNELPYRIELYDDEVDTLRTFDPTTQLSQQSLSSLNIVPNLNTRFRQDQKVSLFKILPENTVIWVKDIQFLIDRLQYCFERAEQFATKVSALDSAELREIFRDRAFLFPSDVLDDVSAHPLVFLEGKMEQLKKTFPALF